MAQVSTTVHSDSLTSFRQRLVEGIKKITWKHGIAITLPVVVYLMRWKIVKACLQLRNVISKNHEEVDCSRLPKQILLTCNDGVTLKNIMKIQFQKGGRPEYCSQNLSKSEQIKMFGSQKQVTFFNSHPPVIQRLDGKQKQFSHIYSQLLFLRLKSVELENRKIDFILIKATQPVLQLFLIKFYNYPEQEIYKVGIFNKTRVQLLKLNEKYGNYERINIDIDFKEK